MTRKLTERLRRGLARRLWPQVFDAPASAFTYDSDGLRTEHASDFLDNPLFLRAYAAGKATGSWWDRDVHWRAYVVCWAASRGRTLAGDYVECGVHRGGYSRMLAEYVDLASLPGKKLYLVDSYCGVPERFVGAELAKQYADAYGEFHDDVVRTFAPWPNAIVVRGVVPDVLPQVGVERVCYVSIDMNCVEPSIEAARHFWPIMTSGAVMVLDDYGFLYFQDQKVAFDRFAKEIGTEILSLPTGQGLLIKP